MPAQVPGEGEHAARQGAGSQDTRENGNVRLVLLADEDSGLPYGVYPQLALTYLTTRAVFRGERRFVPGESVNDCLRLMGIADSGGETGVSTRAREQPRRLCRTAFSYKDEGKRKEDWRGVRVAETLVWGAGRALEVVLDPPFFDTVRAGAVPLDAGIVGKLRRPLLNLDTYAWLAQCVCTVKKDTLIN